MESHVLWCHVVTGIVLGSLFTGGWLISAHELKAGDLISFLVATQMIERWVIHYSEDLEVSDMLPLKFRGE